MTHPVIGEAKKIFPKNSSKDLKSFLDSFFKRVPEEDIDLLDPISVSEVTKSHWDLSKKKKAGPEPSIRIYTPTIERDGWSVGRTVIDIVQEDMAFLIDSVVAEIVRHNQLVYMLLHPTLHVARTKSKLKSVSTKATDDSTPELHIHIQLRSILSDAQAEELKMGLLQVLDDVDYATRDWLVMREKLRDAQKSLSLAPKQYSDELIEEYQAFLEYLYNNNFTLLGYREYKFVEGKDKLTSKVVSGSSLGLLHKEVQPVYINEARKSLTQPQQKLRRDQSPLTIAKVNKRSTVHRRVPLDAIAVKTFDKKGKVIGEVLFIGLFTSVTYSRSVTDIPYLRTKIRSVVSRAGFEPGSHNYKALRHILEKYPRDEVLQISEEQLYKHTISILRLQERPRIALYTRTDPFGRYISCLVYIPRDRYEARLRLRFRKILEDELGGNCTNFQVTQDDSTLARVIYLIDINHLSKRPKFDNFQIEQKLEYEGRLWSERLRGVLDDLIDSDGEIASIIQKYGLAFPVAYQERYTIKQAVSDIYIIEQVLKDKKIGLDLYKPADCEDRKFRLKVFHRDAPVVLSDVLPKMENMGLRVLAELPFEVHPHKTSSSIWIHDFLIEVADNSDPVDVDAVKDLFEEAFAKIWHQEVEDSSLNQLALGAQMYWRDIVILRAYIRYIQQIGIPFSRLYVENAVTSNPQIAQLIVKLFRAFHDPNQQKDVEKETKKISAEINRALQKVASLDHDRILRGLIDIVRATLRTNFFQTDQQGNPKPYLSLKLDSSKIEALPNPKPFREIFVYSPRVEGIHLRGDWIARGGLRWSDRHEDFRTEILGLKKAQQVKNSVIVPMGAKGGFVVKCPPKEGGRQAFFDEGVECYKIFIRGLLDITDNRQGDKIIPPKNVVRRDPDDPYLVVAADKGTATFSDIANSLSQEYGFWMDDAFASGGSAGYDHKKMGITARGAWESVKRLFRELNHDTQKQDFDVVGVGDMGGDVFGNGMLLSEHIRLMGAFNHLHIFCDPDPDAATSFEERQRLFDNVLGWDQYNSKKLSKGGKIYDRSAKSLTLTPEIKKRFDIAEDNVTPNELIRAILKSRVDLLWFGGIGTYIKGTNETNADAGDKANDTVRLNGSDIRAKVIGEGANLGLTQAGRIEFAENGGRLNADFIDNSAGVDSSDHEVNIKILLGDVMAQAKNKMDLKTRNKLLESMTDSVASHVLRNNYQQVQGISLMEIQAAENLAAHAKFISDLERDHGFDRALEGLPDQDDIDQRLRGGKGLTRPELSVIQAYAKINFGRELLASDIPESKSMDGRLLKYFPSKLSKNYAPLIRRHRLKREIICTTLANSMVNRMGPTFIKGRIDKIGCKSEDVAKAYIIVREAFGLRPIWDAIEALDTKVPAAVQLKALRETSKMIGHAVTWFLTRYGRKLDINRDVAAFQDGIQIVKKNLDAVAPEGLSISIRQMKQSGIHDGLPKALAHDIALMQTLASACDIIRISIEKKTDILMTTRAYFELGESFHFDWMRQQARFLPVDDRWSAEALDGLIDQLYGCQAGLTTRILKDMKAEIAGKKISGNSKTSIVKLWSERYGDHAELIHPLFEDLRSAGTIDLPMLIIAEQRLRNLYGG